MHQFSWLEPHELINTDNSFISSEFNLSIKNIIDPSFAPTPERMENFLKGLGAPDNKAVLKFSKKIATANPSGGLKDAENTATELIKLGKGAPQADHTPYYFQQQIPFIDFKTQSGTPSKIEVFISKTMAHTIADRLTTSPYSRNADGDDVFLISNTDKHADLFLLRIAALNPAAPLKSKAQLLALYQLWDIYTPIISEAINYPKAVFKAPRPQTPYYLDSPPTYAYPGGHATGSAALATLLLVTSGLVGSDFKSLSEKLDTAVTYIADLRVMAGIHYQEDTDAGLKLGYNVMLRLLDETITKAPQSELCKLLQFVCNGH